MLKSLEISVEVEMEIETDKMVLTSGAWLLLRSIPWTIEKLAEKISESLAKTPNALKHEIRANPFNRFVATPSNIEGRWSVDIK